MEKFEQQNTSPSLEQLQEQLRVLRNNMKAFDDVVPADRAEVERLEKLIADHEDNDKTPETVEPDEGIAWSGNWAKGERPPGYVPTTERYMKLKRLYKFSLSNSLRIALGDKFNEWVNSYNEAMEKAKSGASLTRRDVDNLLRMNMEIVKSLEVCEENNK